MPSTPSRMSTPASPTCSGSPTSSGPFSLSPRTTPDPAPCGATTASRRTRRRAPTCRPFSTVSNPLLTPRRPRTRSSPRTGRTPRPRRTLLKATPEVGGCSMALWRPTPPDASRTRWAKHWTSTVEPGRPDPRSSTSRTDSRPGCAAKDPAFRWSQQRRRKVPARGARRIAGLSLPWDPVLPRRDRSNVRRSARHRLPIAARIRHHADQQPPLLLPTRLVRCAFARRRACWRGRTREAGRTDHDSWTFVETVWMTVAVAVQDVGPPVRRARGGWARRFVRSVLMPARAGASWISTSVDAWRLVRTTGLPGQPAVPRSRSRSPNGVPVTVRSTCCRRSVHGWAAVSPPASELQPCSLAGRVARCPLAVSSLICPLRRVCSATIRRRSEEL